MVAETAFVLSFIIVAVFLVPTFMMGRGVGMGMVATYTNNLPDGLMKVVYSDKITTLLEEVSPERKRYSVVTEAFAGEPIKNGDIVRKIKHDSERQGLKNPVFGYPPMIKDTYCAEA